MFSLLLKKKLTLEVVSSCAFSFISFTAEIFSESKENRRSKLLQKVPFSLGKPVAKKQFLMCAHVGPPGKPFKIEMVS